MKENSTSALALINGRISADNGTATAVYMKDGIIRAVGADRDILALCKADTTVLDMRKKRILPGITDVNTHLLAAGREIYSRTNKLHFPYRPEEIKEWFNTVKKELLLYGITSVYTEDSDVFEHPADAAAFYRTIDKEEGLPFRVTYMVRVKNVTQLREYIKSGILKISSENFRTGAFIIRADGDLASRSAALKKDYSDSAGVKGEMLLTPEELVAIINEAEKANCRIIFEAQGDLAAEKIAQAVSFLRERGSMHTTHRIRNLKLAPAHICEQLRRNGIAVELTPQTLISDGALTIKKLGAERSRESNAWRTMLLSGVVMGAGSDSPVNKLSPFTGMRYITLRQDENNQPHFGWMPAERLTREEAYRIYTAGNAMLCGEKNTGRIEPGCRGDIAVFMEDVFDTEDEEFINNRSGLTIVNGKIKYIK